MFSAAELAALQALALEGMPETATILRRTETPGSRAGTSLSYPADGTTVCGFMPIQTRGGEQLGASGGPLAVGQGRLRLPVDTTVTTGDRLQIGDVVYEVGAFEPRGTAYAAMQIASISVVGQETAT